MNAIIVASNPFGLPTGTSVEELSRREVWDHQGCLDSVRTVLVEVRLPTGETRTEILEQGYVDSAPWSGKPWLQTS